MKTPIKIKGYVYRMTYNGEIVFVTSPNLNASMGYIQLGELEIDTEFDIPEVDEKEQLRADIDKRADEAKKVYEGVEKAIEYNVVTIDLNPDTKFGTNEVGEFVSNFILNKDDLMYFNNDNVHLGQSTIV